MKLAFLPFILLCVSLVGCAKTPTLQSESENVPGLTQETTESAEVEVTISFGESTSSGVVALSQETTVLEALDALADQETLSIEKKTYDFGTLVESINGYANSNDNVWIFYVNDQPSDVGADQKILQSGDVVEWRYETFSM